MGTSKFKIMKKMEQKDHPHAYGDKTPSSEIYIVALGSSPRVWGQARGTNFSKGDKGIIPTRMGTSDGESTGNKSKEDHPHAYGDKFSLSVAV